MEPPRLELIGGRERRTVVLAPYDPQWPRRAAQLCAELAEALAGTVVRVEHIGSTSVPGLAAKPILDLQLGVRAIDAEHVYGPPLQRLGYELRVRELGEHRMYRTPAQDVHVHLWIADSDHERRHLLFCDWLRTSSADRDRYAATKQALAGEWDDMNDYAQAKGATIAEITARADAWAERSGWAMPPPLPGAPPAV